MSDTTGVPKDIKEMLDNIEKSPAMKNIKPWTEEEYKAHMLSSDVAHKFKALLQSAQIKFDWNGHHKRRVTQPKFPPSYTYEFRREFGIEESVGDHCTYQGITAETAPKIAALLENPGEYVPFGKCTYTMGCYHCGKDIPMTFNGRIVKAGTKCKYPNGMPPIKVNVSVPSGRLVFVNFFAKIDPPADSSHNAMGALAYKMESRHYAKHNIAYGFCGNSCPGIWLNAKKDKIIVGNPAVDDKYEEIPNPFPGYERVDSVTTDLWAWSGACYDTAKLLEEVKKEDAIKVIPGKYRVSQLFQLVDYDNRKIPQKYATIERIGR